MLTALVAIEGDSGIYEMEVIEVDGRLWLVPTWLDTLDGKTSVPERIVLLGQFEHVPRGGPEGQTVVTRPVPRPVFYSNDPQAEAPGFVVHLHPARRNAVPDH